VPGERRRVLRRNARAVRTIGCGSRHVRHPSGRQVVDRR
jgi:hypothetical protein